MERKFLMQYKLQVVLACLAMTLTYARSIAAPLEITMPRATLTLAKANKTTYTITLATDAIPAEKTAASQLQKYLQEVTGAAFPIRPESEVETRAPQILVGAGKRVKTLLPQQQWSALGNDGIVVKTVGNSLILAGGRPRGTLYAVFQFLEDSVGCRWWTPTENHIPRKTTLEIKPQNVTYVSPFTYREHYTRSVRIDPVFATILRENGHHQTQPPEWGGHYTMLGFVHTFSELLPVEKHFAQHPEWYSDPENGFKPATAASKMPIPQATDLCLSNPEVQEAVTREALAWIEKNPDAGYISISQNDNNDNYCRDDEAVRLIEREGSPSAPLIKFVNIVAGKIHEKYPDFLVETLAYNYSEKPPKTIRPAKNVIVRLAPIKADFGHPIDSDWNAPTRDRLLGWSKLSSQLFVWNYVTNFRANMLPHPNWDGLAKDLRFFAANNVTGVFEQGDAYTDGVGDFVQLRTWLMAKLMWNPKLDQDKLMDEFLEGYYGAAAPYLKQYINLVQSSYRGQNKPLTTFNLDLTFFSLDVMNQSLQLWDQAAAAVKNDKDLSYRIGRDRLSLDLARLYQFNMLQRAASRENKQLLGNPDPKHALQEFITAAQNYGVLHYSEGVRFEAQIPTLEAMFSTPPNLPEFAKQYPAYDVISLQPGKYYFYGKGSLSFLEPDPQNPDKTVASINGNINDWAIQALLSQMLTATSNDKWHIYAMVRADFDAGEKRNGMAFQSGIYDDTNRKYINTTDVPIDLVQDNIYQPIDLGTHELNGNMFIWFAPGKNPAVKKLYIDNIILIREDE